MITAPTALISTEAFGRMLGRKSVRVVDASWYMPADKRDARAEYSAMHIPGASFFDIDDISDHGSPYPHMLPSPGNFAVSICALGIRPTDEIVVYDSSGIFSSPRAWWMFRTFGHQNVRVLDGGLPKWIAEERRLESGAAAPMTSNYVCRLRPELLRNKAVIESNIMQKRELVVDARSPGRFNGTEPEPRPGLAGGHIEGSKNLFFKDCLTPPYNTLKSKDELRALFAARSIDPAEPIVATCGSGITACILALALYELGNTNVAVYDGAWAEWGSQPP